MGKILPVVILLVTCTLVAVVLWRILKQEFTQLGLFCALGYRKKELISHYLIYAFALSLPGSMIGTMLGLLLLKPFIQYIASFYNLPIIHIQYDFHYIMISLFLPILFVLPTVLILVRKALGYTPLELLRGIVSSTKTGILEKHLKLNKFRFKTKFKIREIVRNVPRTFLMLLGTLFASALLLLGFSMKDSMDYLVQDNLNSNLLYQYDYLFNSFQTMDPAGGEKLSYSPFTYNEDSDQELTVLVYGVQPNSEYVRMRDSNGNVLSTNQVIATRALADKIGVKEGDYLQLINKVTLKPITLKIDSIAQYYLGGYLYLPLDTFNSICGYPQGSYLELYSSKKLELDDNTLISSIDKKELVKGYKEMMKPIQAMIGMMGFMAVLIGLIIIYVVTSLIIEENKSSISLLKIIGYRKKELYSLMLNTNTILVIVGYVIAIPVVWFSTGEFFHIMTADLSFGIPVRLSNGYLVVGFLCVFLIYEFAKALNRRKILSVNMTDSLKNRME